MKFPALFNQLVLLTGTDVSKESAASIFTVKTEAASSSQTLRKFLPNFTASHPRRYNLHTCRCESFKYHKRTNVCDHVKVLVYTFIRRNLPPQSFALKTADSSETSIRIYQNTCRHILRGWTQTYKSISCKQQSVLRLHIALPDDDATQIHQEYTVK